MPSPSFEPAYLALHRRGALRARAAAAREHLRCCDLCANLCRVDRLAGAAGARCRTNARAKVHAAFAHFGEEDVLRGTRGSGTIFFSDCNMRCSYCQNAEISWRGAGEEVSPGELAARMLRLEAEGCHNVNLVSPSHVVAQVVEAVAVAAERGLRLPLVWNSGGYDSLHGLGILDGIVDIYMPDLKYADAAVARAHSGVEDYPAAAFAAVREMHRQVGDLQVGEDGLARRGLLVRHLVLPGDLAGTDAVMAFLAREVSPATWVNLMDQYRPCHRAPETGPLARQPTAEEFGVALAAARRHGLWRLDRGGLS